MRQWFYVDNGKQIGPIEESDLRKFFETGLLDRNTLVWTHGQKEWASAREIEGLLPPELTPPPIPATSLKQSSGVGSIPDRSDCEAGMIEPDPELTTFIGKNSGYYLKRWAQLDITFRKISYSFESINWAAFFLNVFWMAYRKMYAVAIIYTVGVFIMMGIVEAFVSIPTSVNNGISIALMGMCGVFGNHLYRRHVERQLAKIRNTIKKELWDATIRKKGGVSYLATIPFIILHLINLVGMVMGLLGGVKQ